VTGIPRPLLLLVVSAAVVVGLASACGGDDSDSDDPRISQIGGVAELATYAYAAAGAHGLYDYLAPQVTQYCSREGLAEALQDMELPTGFRAMTGVKFDGEKGRATVVLIFGTKDEKVQWVFVQAPDGGWRIAEAPGLERCSN